MIKASAAADLESLYDQQGEDVSFSSFLLGFSDPPGDEQLAELIELDGRKRLIRGLPVPLERYLSAVPDLRERPDALDAAIEVALRWLARSSRVDPQAVEKLVRQYPDLEQPIREAASLNNALWSTTGLRDVIVGRATKSLPHPFGPALADGQNRYELRSLLGVGATGQVYLAVDRQMSEPGHEALVAVKILPRQDTTILQRVRLADEATKARRVDHPNVVRVLDRGTSDEFENYVVSEYVEGSDLARWLHERGGQLAVRTAVALVAGMARGVQAAHSAGLVHCDLKPSNILMTRDGQPKITDFGIAMRVHEAEVELRQMERDRPIGNLAFISPEQYRMDDGAFSAPSDIYALGGVLYLLLTGRLPNGDSIEAIARHHARGAQGEGTPVSIDRRGVDRDLLAICRRALEPDPRHRYSAAGSLAEDLEAWLALQPLYWTRPSVGRVVRLWVRRQPAVALLLLLLLASLVGGGAALQFFAGQAQLEAARRAAVADAFRRIGERIVSAAESRPPTTKLLEVGWMHQYTTGSPTLPVPIEDPNAARAKFVLLERWIALQDQSGLGGSLNALVMKKTFALWLIGEGEYERALQLIAELRAILTSEVRLSANDSWWDDLDCFELMARARGLAGAAAVPTELHELAVRLEGHRQRYDELDRGSPLHLAVLETLERVYGPNGLADGSAHRTIRELRQATLHDRSLLRPAGDGSNQ